MLNYKGYVGVVEFDDDAGEFYGEVINTNSVITFKGKSVSELKKEFELSVDEYLSFCQEKGIKPEKPYSGKFVLRTDPQVHGNLVIHAKRKGVSLNTYVNNIITSHLKTAN